MKSKMLSLLGIGAAMLSVGDNTGGGFVPETTKGGGYTGKQMPRKWYQHRKKRMQLQKESRRKNRA